jgi:hypothetical protein
MTKQFNLTGKTYDNAMDFYNAQVKAEVTEFHQDNDGVVDYDTLSNYIELQTSKDPELFVPVTPITVNDVDENVSVGKAKQIVAQNEKDMKLYRKVSRLSFYQDVVEELMRDFVRNSFPDRELSDKQISAITDKAYEDGHGYGMTEVVSYLDDEIDMVKNFLA